MLLEIVRFNREAPVLLESAEGELTLGEYLQRHRYSPRSACAASRSPLLRSTACCGVTRG